MNIYHNSHNTEYRSPFGAAVCSSWVRLAVDARGEGVSGCVLHLHRHNKPHLKLEMEPEKSHAGRYCADIETPDKGGLLYYWFEAVLKDGGSIFYGNNEKALGGAGRKYDKNPTPYQITVYETDTVPQWYKNAVVYQIFPDRFARGADWERRQRDAGAVKRTGSAKRIVQQDWDDIPFYGRDEKGRITRWPFFGGTLEGIRERLPYLKELGVTVIYLNPIFKAASNHRYDTADYMKIDEGLGDEESFRALARDAAQNGIRLILDGVFSHTGADSVYFNKFGHYDGPGAFQGKKSPYYKWYRFTKFPREYESWWGVGDLPNVEETEPSYSEFIYGGQDSVVRHWLRAGASGWRLDVADELPDSFIRGLRQAMGETDENSLLLGEVWEDASNKESYGITREYLLGHELQSTMNYPFRTAAIDYILGRADAGELCALLMSLKENYPPENFYGALNLIGSHDRRRILTELGEAPEPETELEAERYILPEEKRALAVRRLKIMSILQFTAAGVPCIYYGDEAGMQGFEDPFNRGPYPWGREDGEILAHFRKIIDLRKKHKAFVSGEFLPVSFSEHVYGCLRWNDKERFLVLINRGVFEHETVTVETERATVPELLFNKRYKAHEGKVTLLLEPVSAMVLKI